VANEGRASFLFCILICCIKFGPTYDFICEFVILVYPEIFAFSIFTDLVLIAATGLLTTIRFCFFEADYFGVISLSGISSYF